MGLTQHQHAVATIREVVNFLLLRGNIGTPGRRRLPGARPLATSRATARWASTRSRREASSTRSAPSSASTRRASTGYDIVEAIRAMRDGTVDVFFALGGNFAAATPDTDVTAGRAGERAR